MKSLFISLSLILTLTLSYSQNNWKTFNGKYGFKIDLPDYFQLGSLTRSGIQYFNTTRHPRLIIGVETSETLSEVKAIEELNRYYLALLKTQTGITDNIKKDREFTISSKNGDEFMYIKSILRNTKMYTLNIQYPLFEKNYVESIITHISESLD